MESGSLIAALPDSSCSLRMAQHDTSRVANASRATAERDMNRQGKDLDSKLEATGSSQEDAKGGKNIYIYIIYIYIYIYRKLRRH